MQGIGEENGNAHEQNAVLVESYSPTSSHSEWFERLQNLAERLTKR